MVDRSKQLPKGRRLPDAAIWTTVGLVLLWPFYALKWLLTKPIGLATLACYVALSSWLSEGAAQMVFGWVFVAPAMGLLGWWIVALIQARRGRPELLQRWDALAKWRVRTWWWKVSIYNRRWKRAVRGAGLVKVRPNARDDAPKIRRVRAGRYVERLSVRMVDGQDVEQWEAKTRALAHSLRCRRIRVLEDRPGRLTLECATEDPLREVVAALEVPDFDAGMNVVEFLQGVPIGMRDDGETWRLQVLGKHVLVAGSMGSGKGSVIWATLAQLAPLIHEGLVEVWAADPKGGMELGIGRPLFARLETTPEGIAAMLTEAADRMDERCDRFGLDGTRLHEPTRRDPLVLVLIDEIANLTAYGTKTVRDTTNLALGRLLSKGRAPAFVVLGALQDPRKEVLPLRGLFPARICLRVDSRTETDMVLGEKQWEAGALCDRINDAPNTEQGVGYVKLVGSRGTTRVRAGWWSNEAVAEVARRFPWRGRSRAVEAEGRALEAVGGVR